MKVTCTVCGKEIITMGWYYEVNYKGRESEYICLICRVKNEKE